MKDKIIKTIKENGFLIFLFICVCIVAITTISIVLNGMDGKSNDDLVILENPSDQEEISDEALDLEEKKDELQAEEAAMEGEEVVEGSEEGDKVALEGEGGLIEGEEIAEEVFSVDEEVEDEEIEFIDKEAEEKPQQSKSWIMPVQGEILTEFTKDKLIYSETLEEWRGHTGIDIKAAKGTIVMAPMDGLITRVYEDSLWGKTVEIDHGDGIRTKYSNLGTLDMVKEGIEVKKGDHIGTVGNSALIEIKMDDHLHFEVFKNNKSVDPRSIIP